MEDVNLTFSLEQIKNKDTLNVFSDASMRKSNDGTFAGCYYAVAVCGADILDNKYGFNSDSTVNACEIRGIRNSIILAMKYRYQFPYINIFCDSQVSVFGLRDYLPNWFFDPETGLLYNSTKQPVANQSVFVECNAFLANLRMTNIVNLYHQSGHVKNGYECIEKAANIFKRSNRIPGVVDLNLIRYISLYNNYVDRVSRSILRKTNIFDNNFIDPVEFSWKKDGGTNNEE